MSCGRLRLRHALNHHLQHRHNLTLKIRTLEIYCYACQKWLGTSSSHSAERAKVQSLTQLFSTSITSPEHLMEVHLNSRRQHERDFSTVNWNKAVNEDHCKLVSSSWIFRWSDFLLGNTLPPGPIDNRSLLLEDGSVNTHIVCGVEFHIVGKEEWESIRDIYSVVGRALSEDDIRGDAYVFVRKSIADMRSIMVSNP
ncbi:hypothetical protein BC938DRAFT_475050 [Jimgerdemannia flammicorona]|uniref:Uncharacterized protein n=1 Tax=Jimgerdemannia flammicorona TaxID=994334 RepID=A0A433Q100_9FUNG|nr:hypothetical protein BC938DRAFT_475050 [Jimgerdemannia flammicorona]